MKFAAKKGSRRILLTLVLAGVMIFTMTISSFAISDGDTIRFTSHHANPDAPIPTRVFDAAGLTGTCCQAGNEAANSGTAVARKVSNSSKTAKIAFYYGYQKGWLNRQDAYPGFNVVSYSLIMQSLIQCSVQGKETWAQIEREGAGYDERTIATVFALYDGVDSLGITVPDNFQVFQCGPSDGSQNFVIWGKAPTGKVKMQKVSGNTDITG